MEKYCSTQALLALRLPLTLLATTCAVACSYASAEQHSKDNLAAAATANSSSTSLTNGTLPHAQARDEGDRALALAASAPREAPAVCPEGMILVEGEYCPNVDQTCLEWMDPPGNMYSYFRCAKYSKPATKCKGRRVHKRFCIDRTERTEPGSDLPMNKKSWTDSKNVCEGDSARLCLTSEWQFACEGEEMRPYPYGWERDAGTCNVDIMTGLGRVGRLTDHRTPAGAHPKCVSPFGVHDMAGNVDEWASVDGQPRGSREVMKGSWWLPGRHTCRSFQGGHGANYGGTESGVRCCKDAPPSAVATR